MPIKLGDRVTDIITGFKGVAWSRCSYLTSPDQIGVMSRVEEGRPEGTIMYVDEDRLMATALVELQQLKYGGGGDV